MARKTEKRRYSGQSFADRHAERRDRLVRAAVLVAGRVGLEAASVAAICAEAGLTARYFYESFPTREAIFVEAYRAVQDELLARIAQAAHGAGQGTGHGAGQGAVDARRALARFYAAIRERPDLARVFLIDLDDAGGAMRMASFEGAHKLAKAFGLKATHPLTVAGIVGAIVDIAKRWIESDFAEPPEKVVDIALPFTRIRG
ncbi:MAG TPA: TetR/AcrR family transcriptional regulator [Rhizomicrobium sp.]|nr:TetR/AcrR family transcriptional regulator [Rhizomicrobium sp.]